VSNSRRHCASRGSCHLTYLPWQAHILTVLDLGFKAYSAAGDFRQIITGVSEIGPETRIRYWIQPYSTLKRVQPRPKAAKEKLMEFLTTHVSQDSCIKLSWLTSTWQKTACMSWVVAIVTCTLVLWYWEVHGIHQAWGQFGHTLRVPSSSLLTWRQSGTQDVMIDDRWDFLQSNGLLDKSSSTFRDYPMENSPNN
jgi:hypothetical protein